MKYLNTYDKFNESVRNLMKGKSYDEIKKSLENLPYFERLYNGLEFGIYNTAEILRLCTELTHEEVLYIAIKFNMEWLIQSELQKKSFDIKFVKGNVSTNGTFLLETLDISYKSLLNIFGKPELMGWNKKTIEWTLKDNNGNVATIYSTNEDFGGVTLKEIKEMDSYEWHIGGKKLETGRNLLIYIYLKERNLI